MENIIEYIEDGITITKNTDGTYRVFTPKTQHFSVSSLSELTPEKFEEEILKEVNLQLQEDQLLKIAFEEDPYIELPLDHYDIGGEGGED